MATVHAVPVHVASAHDPAHQAWRLLHFAFVVAPLVAGLDKFTHLLTDWTKYLAPAVPRITGISDTTFMQLVGLVEIAAGLLVLWKPRIGATIVAAWLWAIIVNLLLVGGYLDIALRDLGLSLGALALGRLSSEYARR